jgi:hypothetical protein
VVEPPGAHESLAPTLYLGMDGTGVPVRKTEVVDRPGKQPDGSAKTREVKLVTVWSAEGRDEDGTPVRDAGSISYSAAIESAAQKDTDETLSAFATRVEREATRRGFDRVARRAVLGDGATWIWNLADERFPDAVQIVDRFHVKQHLSDVGKAVYGATSDVARAWARARHDESDAGNLDAVLGALRPHAVAHDEARRASTTSSATARACATRRSGRRASAPRPASSRRAARWRSGHAASGRACTGRWPGPTRLSRCVAAS